MKYALNLSADGRILSATFSQYAPPDAVKVDELPEGNIAEYRYENGEFVHDQLTEPEQPEPEAEATTEELLNILLGVSE